MKLVIIRHGETTFNVQNKVQGQANPPLTEKGINQAKEAAALLKNQMTDFKEIYCSTLQRAVKTAEVVRGNLKIPIKPDPRLSSRNLGLFSGKTLQEIETLWPKEYKMWISGDVKFRPPEGESTEENIKRTEDFICFIKTKYQHDEKILIVTHRENIGFFYYLIKGKKMEDPLGSIGNCTPYEFEI